MTELRRIESIKRASKWNREHPDRRRQIVRESMRRSRAKNPEKYRQLRLKAYAKNPNKYRKSALERRNKHLDVSRERNRKWNRVHRSSINAYVRYKTASDSTFKLLHRMRNRITRALTQKKKLASTISLLGCSAAELKNHIQKQFKPGMAWNNYGYRGWHVDHIRPLASFDLFDLNQQREAFSYKNLQPLWGIENMRKHTKIVEVY